MAEKWTKERIENLIQDYGLSNAKLAALCNTHWTTVSRWRNGQEPNGAAQKVLTEVEKQLRKDRKGTPRKEE